MKNAVAILKKNTMLIVLVLVFIFFTITTKGQMFTANQFNSLITQNAYVFILATGMLMCMLTGGNIDLSCGSFVCFIGVIGGLLMVLKEVPVPVAIIITLIVGAIYGCVLGYLIAYVNIPPWIATLAGYLAFRGWAVALLTSNTTTGSIAPLPKSFLAVFSGKILETAPNAFNVPCFAVGVIASVLVVILQLNARAQKVKKGYEVESMVALIVKTVLMVSAIMLFAYKLAFAGGIPTVLVWVVVIVIIYSFITSKTTIGRYFYTIGGNAEATRLSGIDTKKIMFLAYLNMAILTTVTAWIVMAKFQAANSTAGTNFEMDAISACVVGGVSAYGGSGSVFGMIIGATLIGVINLGMSLMGVDANWQKVVKGVVLLGAVVFDILNAKDKSER
ncbi:MAG: sugar ABC transporter permease [Lachnospiraceae bacterium]|nr:sugar ABC transporter permease [Lachnospiraceae bacterium]